MKKRMCRAIRRIKILSMLSICLTILLVIPTSAKERNDSAYYYVNDATGQINEAEQCGKCGVNAYWTVDRNRLTVYGTGRIWSYYEKKGKSAPWYAYKERITQLEVKEGITKIGNYCFADLSNLQEVKLPETLLQIEDCAFINCGSLKKLIVPSAVEEIGEYAVGYRIAKQNYQEDIYECIPDFVIHCLRESEAKTYAEENKIKYYIHDFKMVDVEKPDCENNGSINYACKDCGYVSKESIEALGHEYKEKIEREASIFQKGRILFSCIRCKKKIKRDLPFIKQQKGIIFTQKGVVYEIISAKYNRHTLRVLSYEGKSGKLKIPDEIVIQNTRYAVEEIGKEAFSKNIKLRKVYIGKNVKKIGSRAFSQCLKLKTLVLRGEKIEDLGYKIFIGVNKKLKIKVPKRKYTKYKKLFRHELPSQAKIVR